MEAKTEARADYAIDVPPMPPIKLVKPAEDEVIRHAMDILKKRLVYPTTTMLCTADTAGYLILKLAQEKIERFGVLYFDTQLRLIEDFMPFYGTIDHVEAHGREIFKRGLEVYADSMVVYHNHPSGEPRASEEDKRMTSFLLIGCMSLGIELLDHIIIGGDKFFSFGREGLLRRPN